MRVLEDTWEFVLKNGKKIKIRNAQFIDCAVSLADLAALTEVKLSTLKKLSTKFGKDLVIVFDKFGQPNFTKYMEASVKIAKEKLTKDYAKAAWGLRWRRNWARIQRDFKNCWLTKISTSGTTQRMERFSCSTRIFTRRSSTPD